MEACSEYDYEYYFRLVNIDIPILLKYAWQLGYKFYVKGGKAADAYIDKKIGSPDWDMIVYRSHINDMSNLILRNLDPNYSSDKEGSLFTEIDTPFRDEEPDVVLHQIGIKLCGGLYFIDMMPTDVIYNPTVIDGIPYINSTDLEKDLDQTIKDRMERYEGRLLVDSDPATLIAENTKVYNTEYNKYINRIKKKINSNIDKEALTEKIIDDIEMIIEYKEAECKIRSHEWRLEYENLMQKLKELQIKIDRTQKRLLMIKHVNEHEKEYASKEYIDSLCNECFDDNYRALNPVACDKMCTNWLPQQSQQ